MRTYYALLTGWGRRANLPFAEVFTVKAPTWQAARERVERANLIRMVAETFDCEAVRFQGFRRVPTFEYLVRTYRKLLREHEHERLIPDGAVDLQTGKTFETKEA